MSEGYAIELYFDPALENQVLKAWNVFARRQISTKLITTESRPHLTLLSTSFLDSSKLEPILKAFASKQEPLLSPSPPSGASRRQQRPLPLPTPSLSLLQLQAQLIDAVRKGFEIGEEYRQDSWVPFCPVAVDVPRARMAEAFSVLRDLKMPVSGYAMDVGVVEFSPVREVFSFALGNNLE
ncbi:hypothetical protein Bca52824_068399 [Brassica carinata]|uniref:RNA ligase/cyclic nucleotide phosphodiesterase family protein n=1 Tax=Brassica carinata TaxID=52824 RepID=A0A8X7Q0P7_BRACI|nr:hypothetical protein Bca52824_068399 [Brassica carinata]